MQTRYRDVPACVTKDGYLRMQPAVHGNRGQSLAEATGPDGCATLLHRHRVTEEIYHITAGTGRMSPGAEILDLSPGDTVCIPAGTPHRIASTGNGPLRILCCSSPAYSHDDTELLEA